MKLLGVACTGVDKRIIPRFGEYCYCFCLSLNLPATFSHLGMTLLATLYDT